MKPPAARRALPAFPAAACAALALVAAFAARAAAQPAQPAADAKPHVIRTMTHHQVTADDRGVWTHSFLPVVSDSGNRIVFALAPAVDGQPYRLATVSFDGGKIAVLDDSPDLYEPDLTADGSRVVYLARDGLRTAAADGTGRQTLLKTGGIHCPRFSGDGRVIVFLVPRGITLQDGDKSRDYGRGVYAIDPDGRNFRRVVGQEEIAKLRGITNLEDVGYPNFCLGYLAGSLDVSTDGGHVAFGCWVKGVSTLLGCDIDGRNLHVIAERTTRKGDSVPYFAAIALSGDATTVAYHTNNPSQVGVAGFDGKRDKVLLEEGSPDEFRFQWISGSPIYVTVDGARVTYTSRQFNADGSGAFELMATHQNGVLNYLEYPTPAADAQGRRFAYWSSELQPVQLATMELNVPWDRLRGAPKVSDLVLDPPAVPREIKGSVIVRSRIAARVAADPPSPRVTGSGFFKGVHDRGMTDETDQYDDGKTTVSGDEKAGDGVFTRRWVSVAEDAPDGPRTLRVEAQVKGKDNLLHATVVEIGPYPVVPGSEKPSQGTTPTIDGTPPPQPTATPHQPGTVVTVPTDPTDPTTPRTGGAIDLTGYWKSDSGAIYFMRQVGDKVYWSMDGLPGVRNAFAGGVARDTLTGGWADLPGGTAIETGAGTLTMKIESNDRLTKVSSTSYYGDSILVRIDKPANASVGISGLGGGGPGPAVTGKAPWDTPEGQAAIERWVAVASAKLNAYDGGKAFNDLKPWGIHPKYGTITNKRATSAFAPDAFPRYNNNKYWWIWDHYVTDANGRWSLPEWNAAGVADLHDFVNKAVAEKR